MDLPGGGAERTARLTAAGTVVPMGRVAVFGDIGGHRRQLEAALVSLGADPATFALPADLQVIQVGDLIHRGPDSAGVVALVDARLREQPTQWHQLAGNHEGQYVEKPRFGWPEVLPDQTQDQLRDWWTTGAMRVAAAVITGTGRQLLATHAGLTAGQHRKLGRPVTAERAATALNALRTGDPKRLWRSGTMLDGGQPDYSAGPMWAEAGGEVAGSWLAAESRGQMMPFDQVHGHSSVIWWQGNQPTLPFPALRGRVRLDEEARQVTVSVAGGKLLGVDPGFGHDAHDRWAPLVLSDATVVA